MDSLNLKLDFLQEAPHYLSHLDSVKSNYIGFNFLSFIKDQFGINVASVFITNYKTPISSSVMYILRLEREKIVLYEKSEEAENNCRNI